MFAGYLIMFCLCGTKPEKQNCLRKKSHLGQFRYPSTGWKYVLDLSILELFIRAIHSSQGIGTNIYSFGMPVATKDVWNIIFQTAG